MKRRASCFLYLLINIVVSAAVTLAVLVLWNRAHPMPVVPKSPALTIALSTATAAAQPNPVELATPRPTFPPGQVLVTIENVFGAGALASEYVLIKSSSEVNLPLLGWQLEDGQGNTFVFPALDLNPGGAIQVHTGPGDNTPIDLYWNQSVAVWAVGKTVTLRDDQGTVRSSYTIP